jgi:hypothetical protein
MLYSACLCCGGLHVCTRVQGRAASKHVSGSPQQSLYPSATLEAHEYERVPLPHPLQTFLPSVCLARRLAVW